MLCCDILKAFGGAEGGWGCIPRQMNGFCSIDKIVTA